jgi:hypothetical protein
MTESVKMRRLPDISTEDNDDIVRTLPAAQMVTAWHDSYGDRLYPYYPAVAMVM